jgi:hypothetical protein
VYSENWQVDLSRCLALIEKNRYTYTVIKEDGILKGYFGHLLLPKTIFDSLLSGGVSEEDAMAFAFDDNYAGDACLYLLSIVTDTGDPNYHRYSKPLVDALKHVESRCDSLGVNLLCSGCLAVTPAGERLSELVIHLLVFMIMQKPMLNRLLF